MAIGVGAAILGSAGIGAATSALSMGLSSGANRAAKAEARRGRRHQIKILQQQIGWRMNDMRRNGLNPILAMGGGFAGSAPSGPSAPVVNLGDKISDVVSTVGTGIQSSLRYQELQNLKEQEAKTKAERKSVEFGNVRKEVEAEAWRVGLKTIQGVKAAGPTWIERTNKWFDTRQSAYDQRQRELQHKKQYPPKTPNR